MPHLTSGRGAARRGTVSGSCSWLLRQAIALHVGEVFGESGIGAVDADVWFELKLPVEIEGIHGALSSCRSSAARERGDNNDSLDHNAEGTAAQLDLLT